MPTMMSEVSKLPAAMNVASLIFASIFLMIIKLLLNKKGRPAAAGQPQIKKEKGKK